MQPSYVTLWPEPTGCLRVPSLTMHVSVLVHVIDILSAILRMRKSLCYNLVGFTLTDMLPPRLKHMP